MIFLSLNRWGNEGYRIIEIEFSYLKEENGKGEGEGGGEKRMRMSKGQRRTGKEEERREK